MGLFPIWMMHRPICDERFRNTRKPNIPRLWAFGRFKVKRAPWAKLGVSSLARIAIGGGLMRIASSRRRARVSKMRGSVVELGGCSSHKVDEHMVHSTGVRQARPNEQQSNRLLFRIQVHTLHT